MKLSTNIFLGTLIILFLIPPGLIRAEVEQISLEEPDSDIAISEGVKELLLERGNFVLTLKKEQNVTSQLYLVEKVYQYVPPGEEAKPEDTFVLGYFVHPLSNQDDIKFFQNFIHKGSINMSAKDMTEARKIQEKVNQYDRSAFNMTILPADSFVRSQAQDIKEGDAVTLSGIIFQQVKKEHDGREDPLYSCDVKTKVFYVTELITE